MTEKAKKPKPAQQSNVESEADTQSKPAQKAKATKGAIALVHVEAASGKQKKTPAPRAERSPKSVKPVKPKMIRDSFTLPENDYTKLNMLKTKCLENGIEVKKSELVRAGLIALSKMPMGTLIKAVGAVERQKTGRPKSK